MIIIQGSASEDEASDASSSTVEDEDKEFSANEEDGKYYFYILLHVNILKQPQHLNKRLCKSSHLSKRRMSRTPLKPRR